MPDASALADGEEAGSERWVRDEAGACEAAKVHDMHLPAAISHQDPANPRHAGSYVCKWANHIGAHLYTASLGKALYPNHRALPVPLERLCCMCHSPEGHLRDLPGNGRAALSSRPPTRGSVVGAPCSLAQLS